MSRARRLAPEPPVVTPDLLARARLTAARNDTIDAEGGGVLLEAALREVVTSYLEPRAAASDAVTTPDAGRIREALAFLQERVLGSERFDPGGPNASLARVGATIATAAWSDMSVAFTFWCHRMVLEYLWRSPADSVLRTGVLPRVARTQILGSTALAAAMAHFVARTPVPIKWREDGGAIVLDGRVNWATNLFPPDFVMVTAAAHLDDGRVLIVALPGDAPGLSIDPYPRLLALQATGSSSIGLHAVRVGRDSVVADDLVPFVTRVRPTFLLLQSSFCFGLAARALTEARAALRGPNEVFHDDLETLESRAAGLARVLGLRLDDRGEGIPVRDLVQLRLDSAQLATAAVALEAKLTGGRGYVTASPTARRLREAAFLPVQAPTEGQLRWELSRFA
jgi:alkylation response protein AidB-like acyl-CoA dehydrogenase